MIHALNVGALDTCCQAELYTCKLSVVYVSCLNQVALNLILEIEVHPEVAQYLTKAVLEELGDSIGRKISIVVNSQISREGYSLMAVAE